MGAIGPTWAAEGQLKLHAMALQFLSPRPGRPGIGSLPCRIPVPALLAGSLQSQTEARLGTAWPKASRSNRYSPHAQCWRHMCHNPFKSVGQGERERDRERKGKGLTARTKGRERTRVRERERQGESAERERVRVPTGHLNDFACTAAQTKHTSLSSDFCSFLGTLAPNCLLWACRAKTRATTLGCASLWGRGFARGRGMARTSPSGWPDLAESVASGAAWCTAAVHGGVSQDDWGSCVELQRRRRGRRKGSNSERQRVASCCL